MGALICTNNALQRYTAALARGTSKTVNVTQMWYSDPKKYECYLKSDFECYSMAIPDPSVLPESFRNACAPAFLIVGTAKSGITYSRPHAPHYPD